MKITGKYKIFLYYLFLIPALCFALDIFPVIKVRDNSYDGFSSERVADDIKYISKQPHSIEHPKERRVVRDYLFHRLEQMGGESFFFGYDSIKCKFGGYFDIANVYARFDPEHVTADTRYLLLVAHLDSRFFNVVLGDTVYSYGAADDGYGLGVILESVKLALKYRNQWKQGIKVLFTDSEEHELDGMSNALSNDRHIFDNVNFVINVEARGVRGKALLFETSPGNRKLMELYRKADIPRGFSLTTLVYKTMPNDTDFTLIKDSVPGFNFAVIDNLHYYHTDLDNFSNISLESLQHYGMQLEPVIKEYMISGEYSSAGSLRSDDDVVFFAFPVFGMFVFSWNQYLIFNIAALVLLFMVVLFYVQSGGIKMCRILKWSCLSVLFAVIAFAAGGVIAYVAAKLTGQQFSLVAVKYIKCDNILLLGSMILCFVSILFFYRYMSGKYKYFALEFLFGNMLLTGLLSLVMFLTVTENFFILIPLFITSVSLLVCLFKCCRWVLPVSSAIITVISVYFIYILYTALTIGALGIILVLWLFYIVIILSHYYKYREGTF